VMASYRAATLNHTTRRSSTTSTATGRTGSG
jgi:hypothetical protein